MTKMEIAHSIKNKIVNNINPKTIVLFGSVANHTEHEESDIDLLVVWDEKKDLSNVKRRIMLRKIIGIIDNPLDVITCSSDELAKALEDEDSFTSRIIREGKLIYGRLN